MSDIKAAVEKTAEQTVSEVRTGTRAAIAREPYTWVLSALGVGFILGIAATLIVKAF